MSLSATVETLFFPCVLEHITDFNALKPLNIWIVSEHKLLLLATLIHTLEKTLIC